MRGSFRFTKIKRLFWLTGKQIEADIISVISLPRTMFTALFGVFSLWFILSYIGVDRVIAEAPMWFVHGASFILAALCMVVLVVLTAPFRAVRNEGLRGAWHGDVFLYHEPQLALTTFWNPADNGKHVDFTWPHAEGDSFIRYKILIEGGAGRTQATVGHRFMSWNFNGPGKLIAPFTGGIRVNKKRELRLEAHSLPSTEKVTIRVYIMSFEVGKRVSSDGEARVGA